MNMCSVRQRPIPSAPNSRAFAASSGVSAFARTRSRRKSSAQPRIVPKFSSIAGGTSGTAPTITRPVPPSIVSWSPSRSSSSPIRIVRASRSIASASQPATHGLPIPRATTAACEVMPPCAVSTPTEWISPWMSSGVVSQRTRSTSSPARPRASARSASSTIAPEAAPGDAFRPVATTSTSALGSIIGCSSWSSWPASIRATASSREMSPSLGHLRGDAQGRLRRPLAGTRLEQVQDAVLDGELDVLHLAVVGLELIERVGELRVGVRHHLAHLLDRLRRADPGDDVLALGVQEELAEQAALTRRGVAREADARPRRVALVAEHHLDDVDRGAEIVRDVVRAPVDPGARRLPRVEHRPDRPPELLGRVLRERRAHLLLVDLLEPGDQLPQVVRRQLDVLAGPASLLEALQLPLEQVAVDLVHDLAVHLDQPAVRVEREARVPVAEASPSTATSFRPRLRIVSIIPGIEIAAPERTETSSGSSGSPKRFPARSWRRVDVLVDLAHRLRAPRPFASSRGTRPS